MQLLAGHPNLMIPCCTCRAMATPQTMGAAWLQRENLLLTSHLSSPSRKSSRCRFHPGARPSRAIFHPPRVPQAARASTPLKRSLKQVATNPLLQPLLSIMLGRDHHLLIPDTHVCSRIASPIRSGSLGRQPPQLRLKALIPEADSFLQMQTGKCRR